MFGHQNNQQDQQQDQNNDTAEQSAVSISPIVEHPAPANHSQWQHPGTPTAIDQADNSIAPEPDSSSGPADDQTAPTVPHDAPSHTDDVADDNDDAADDLIDIKRQALSQLSPLVGHLDQTPAEKFRTTMMMIQASDNQSLVKTAYDAAQQIEDEKTRAQALLDVINEINYFTQHPDK